MTFEEQIRQAFSALVGQEEGNLRQISLKRGLAYSIIHKLYSGESSFSKMSVQTLAKLFPQLRISFFGEEPSGITVNGNNTGAIASGANARAFSLGGNVGRPAAGAGGPHLIDRDSLENQVLHAEGFTSEERIKFLLFLKDKVK